MQLLPNYTALIWVRFAEVYITLHNITSPRPRPKLLVDEWNQHFKQQRERGHFKANACSAGQNANTTGTSGMPISTWSFQMASQQAFQPAQLACHPPQRTGTCLPTQCRPADRNEHKLNRHDRHDQPRLECPPSIKFELKIISIPFKKRREFMIESVWMKFKC